MSRLLRIALGALDPKHDCCGLIWAVLSALEQRGLRVQSFLSQACFLPRDGATTITGQGPRQLDSWLMPEKTCRALFLRGCRNSDAAVVQGQLQAEGRAQEPGGRLDTLCQWLDLPCLAMVSASALAGCKVPPRPAGAQAVLIDGAGSRSSPLRTLVETLWGIPVLGCLDLEPALREATDAVCVGGKPSAELCEALGRAFTNSAHLDRICQLASVRSEHQPPSECAELPRAAAGVRVALAYDDAFNCYFADTLEELELAGATVCDFSPLADERLPDGTDIVYVGCGHPERFGRRLADNQCIQSALRDHLCSGRRIYGEGGGLAYLCQEIEVDGERHRAVGALPAIARLSPLRGDPRPVEIKLGRNSWLGAAGSSLRGYQNSWWELESTGALQSCVEGAEHAGDLVCRHQAIGSRLHLHFAVQPVGVAGFVTPHAAAMDARLSSMAKAD